MRGEGRGMRHEAGRGREEWLGHRGGSSWVAPLCCCDFSLSGTRSRPPKLSCCFFGVEPFCVSVPIANTRSVKSDDVFNYKNAYGAWLSWSTTRAQATLWLGPGSEVSGDFPSLPHPLTQ